jgi:dTDP-4-amino-4,6-dideoxygalactose transaminase
MDRINALAAERGMVVIEDCAQSHGTRWRDAVTGSLGDFGAFSFFATKHMTTGEGGMVTTNDRDAAARMRSFRNHGLEGRDDHRILGYNYRMTEMAAAIGLIQLKRLDELNQRRVAVTERLFERLADVEWLALPIVPGDVRHTYFWAHVAVDEGLLGMATRTLVETLRERGIECRHRYWEPLYRQPVLTQAIPPLLRLSAGSNLPNYGALEMPVAERFAGRVIGLPNRPDMSDEEIEYVSAVIHAL